MKKDFQSEQKPNNEPLPIDSTSSPNCTKPNVICSQSQKDILNEAKKIMLPLDKNFPFKEWFFIFQMHLKNINGFYEWFVETYKSKPKHFAIVSKMEDEFYIDMSQLRLVYLLVIKKSCTNIKDNDMMENVIVIMGKQHFYKGLLPKSRTDEIIENIKSSQNFSSSPK